MFLPQYAGQVGYYSFNGGLSLSYGS